ncbi:uncharacterized protein LOC100640479 precursor [Amphimedon queenslandica]|uniref:SFRPB n=1 Tax=Amphimedon queenslandica TaxID=400682 RepID=E2IJA0_AMPQE|nr:uncharacterized protein LOC100640479 precursor [Amphimedon queenslandica]ADO16572.1 sFRPB [Amphimedon queenslandica]|eukprot:NP_001295557.1 uncharacterized protein LOC100640479 precursor [Amphimedon queenslandica]
MSPVILLFLTIVHLSTFMGQPTLPVSTLPPGPPSTCQPITGVAMCLYVPWAGNASFPSVKGRRTAQSKANIEANVFQPLVTHQCSNAIVHFLCAVYTPACVEGPEGTVTLKPCRGLCNHVRNTCEPFMRERWGLNWPPHFECSNFPENESTDINSLCFDVPFHNVTIPIPPATTSSSTVVQPSSKKSSVVQ